MPTKKTYVGRSLTLEMQRAQITQIGLQEISGIKQSTISQVMTTDVRAAPKTIEALTHCWPEDAANCRVLIAHLRDEIARAGHDPENAIDIRMPDGKRSTTIASRDLDTLRDHISDTDVAALIHDLAVILRRSDREASQHSKKQPSLAAESPEKYTTKGNK